MGAGGMKPGPGGQTGGRPMTPFSMPQDGMQGGMQGFNTRMGGIMGGGDPFKQFQQMQGGGQQAPGYGNPSNFGQMNQQAPQYLGPSAPITPDIQQQYNFARSSEGMRPNPYGGYPQMGQQPPNNPMQQPSSTPMQQGLGGLGAYTGRGG